MLWIVYTLTVYTTFPTILLFTLHRFFLSRSYSFSCRPLSLYFLFSFTLRIFFLLFLSTYFCLFICKSPFSHSSISWIFSSMFCFSTTFLRVPFVCELGWGLSCARGHFHAQWHCPATFTSASVTKDGTRKKRVITTAI